MNDLHEWHKSMGSISRYFHSVKSHGSVLWIGLPASLEASNPIIDRIG